MDMVRTLRWIRSNLAPAGIAGGIGYGPPTRCAAPGGGKIPRLIFAALVVLGCTTSTPTGPLFNGPREPGSGSTRVYLYRLDAHHSFSTVEIRFDGEEAFRILDEEYATFELEEGDHEVEFRLRSAFWRSWQWRKHLLRARPGETIYMKISVGIDEQEIPAGRDLEIAGRDGGTAGETVTLRLRGEREALEQLSRTHLRNRATR